MNQTINEIEGSQLGGAEAADNCASPYNLNELREIVGDIRLLANQYCITPTKCKVTRVMFVESLINMAKRVNGKLPLR